MQDQIPFQDESQVLVIGGGLGGIRTALDLAETGRDVVLIDKGYSIGGVMTQLDRTFPTNNCDLCTVSPHLSEGGRSLHIDLLPLTTLIELTGDAGNFKAVLKTAPRYIDPEKCTACGDCLSRFPECVRFTPGLDPRAPTCMRYPQATPYAFSIDMEKCTDIDALVNICPAGAIIPDDTPLTREINAGSVVLSTGAELFNPFELDIYGGGKLPNVVTGLEYERILSASGPTGGRLIRPSDKGQPKRIAWIQCVGSRGINKQDEPYCSSVCCMYALKEAVITKERFKNDIETTIFYMDMRTFGKDYETYLKRAEDEYNVRLVRSRPHSIDVDEKTSDLKISYITDDAGGNQTEQFDMVVLATGFRIPPETVELAAKLKVDLNPHSFVKTDPFNAVATSRAGIYVCGVLESPKDIPETMVQGSAAACMAARHVSPKRIEAVETDEEPAAERDISSEPPKIGVFICECGANIGEAISVDNLVEDMKKLPDVHIAKSVGYGCSKESLDNIARIIQEENLNRVVIGGCSPRTHETKFQDVLQKAGLNKYMLEIANIRDQNTWVHGDWPDNTYPKAKTLLRMAVSGVLKNRPLKEITLPINKSVLVVGGGVTGMNSALQLAEQGFKVFLLERSAQLGGMAGSIRKTLEGDDVRAYVDDLIAKVKDNKKIQILLSAIIVDHTGAPGMFHTGVHVGPRMQYMRIRHGAAILATGALPNRPKVYLYGEHEAVRTQLELDELIEEKPDVVKQWESVVMIQCVGSRTPENPNCSRVCCQAAVKNALRINAMNPGAGIFVLYRDMRTYGFQEDYYRMARERGVTFVRYEPGSEPDVFTEAGKVNVKFHDPVLGRDLQVEADSLVLSTGFMADDETTEELAAFFHLPRTEDGYFLEDHVKLRPIDLQTRGFFVAGTAHAPKTIRESVVQANAAASRAQTVLSRETISLGGSVARVDGKKCAACLICVRACPFGIPFINADGYSEIDPSKCHGCGVCASECPAKAIQLLQYEDDQIMAKLDGLFERKAS